MLREAIPYLGAGIVFAGGLSFLVAFLKVWTKRYIDRIVDLEAEITKLRSEVAHKNIIIHDCVMHENEIEEKLESLGIEAYDEYGHIGIINMLGKLIEQRDYASREVVRLVREQTIQHMKLHNETRTHGHQ